MALDVIGSGGGGGKGGGRKGDVYVPQPRAARAARVC